ncbi:MAG: hypothetical protein M3178_06475 [Pseudomonadota bacterium]|nr:hypothetical protein [Pseudomonadota bacterium]
MVLGSFQTFALEGELGVFTVKDVEKHGADDREVQGEKSVLVRQWSSSNVMSNCAGNLFSIPPRGRADRGGTGGFDANFWVAPAAWNSGGTEG